MRNRLRPTGFNFAEVLFAVMILGIGFIMIAAIFPVALLQTKSTMEETAAASVSRGGLGYVSSAANGVTIPSVPDDNDPTTPLPPNVDGVLIPVKVGTPLWDALKGNIVLPGDPRYAAAVFYRRVPNQPIAQVIVIPIFSRNQGSFEKVTQKPDPATPTTPRIDNAFVPQAVGLAIANNRATVTGAGAASAVEGAYLVVADDGLAGLNAGRVNGHIFRLASNVGGATWDLMPGWDFPGYPGIEEIWDRNMITGLPGATAYIIGRGLTDPSVPPSATNAREGPAQDLAAYTTFVMIR